MIYEVYFVSHFLMRLLQSLHCTQCHVILIYCPPSITPSCRWWRLSRSRLIQTDLYILMYLIMFLHHTCISTSDLVRQRLSTYRRGWTVHGEKTGKSALLVNNVLVTDPTIRQSGFDLSRRSWSLTVTVSRLVKANPHKWGVASSFSEFGHRRTTRQEVDRAHLYYILSQKWFIGANDDAIQWLEDTATTAVAKWKNKKTKQKPITSQCRLYVVSNIVLWRHLVNLVAAIVTALCR